VYTLLSVDKVGGGLVTAVVVVLLISVASVVLGFLARPGVAKG
jgi:hypothetical protein